MTSKDGAKIKFIERSYFLLPLIATSPERFEESSILNVSDHLKTYFSERPADRYRHGMARNGSIHELSRPQMVHRHSVYGCVGLGAVIVGAP